MAGNDNAKFLKSHHKELWKIADQFFTQLLLETMYVPLSNTPEIPLDDKDVYRAGNDKGPQSLVTFDIRSHGWIWWDTALKHRVINDAVGYIPVSRNYPDSNVFVPLPESWTSAHGNQTIEIFPHTGKEVSAIELLVLWTSYRRYERFFPIYQGDLIAPDIYHQLTKTIRQFRDEKRQGSDAHELAARLTTNIANSRSIEEFKKMARTMQMILNRGILYITALINRGVWA